MPNTTYNFYFIDAIRDNTEGNTLNELQYVFSTGNEIDSLTLTGQIIDAFEHTPENNFTILLYNNLSDSCIFKSKPLYITKSDKNGNFKFNYLKNALYKLVAIDDKNYDYQFNPDNEKIAFLDTIINLTTHLNNLQLYSFKENRVKQFIKKIQRNYPFKVEVFFNTSSDSTPQVINSSVPIIAKWNSINNDSLLLFFDDSTLYQRDTILLTIKYFSKDSLNTLYPKQELIKAVYLKKNLSDYKLSYKINIKNNELIIASNPIQIEFNGPVKIIGKFIDIEQIENDSVSNKLHNIQLKPLNDLMFNVVYNFTPEKSYRLIIYGDSIQSFYTSSRIKTDTVYFKTYSLEELGNCLIKYELPLNEDNFVFELINEKNIVVKSWYSNKSESKIIQNLLPGKYSLRCYNDKNKNGKRDTGFYIKKEQPEKTYIYQNTILIRANWDIQVNWNIK